MLETEDILHLCQIGSLSALQKCLEEGFDPDFQDSEGDSPLQIASANGFGEMVQLLLQKGASIDLANNYGWTPLMHAAKHGHSSTVALLLKMKAKVNISNKLGLSPIVAAAWSGDLPTLKLLMEAGAMVDHMSSLNESNECDLSSLMAAALQGHEDILTFLLEERALINQVSPVTGLSPLMLAAFEGHKRLVRIIVKHGGDTNKQDMCGRSALDLSIEGDKQGVRSFLETVTSTKVKTEETECINVFQAIRNGDSLKVKTATKENPDLLNTFDPNDGITPLMLASMLGHNNIVSLLITGGANVDTQDLENGWTALMYAAFHRHADIVQSLLEKGARIDVCASNGYTVVDLARHTDSSDTSIIEILMSKLMSEDLAPKKLFLNSPSFKRQKLSSSERFFPKRSQTQTGLKSWIGGVAHNLQTKMLTRLSPRHSEKLSNSDSLALDETLVNEVFMEPNSPCEEVDEFNVGTSILLPPDKYLADALKEHKVEAIKPPLKVITYSNFFPVGKPSDKISKPIRNSLQLTHLLRNHNRKRSLVSPRKICQNNGMYSQSISLGANNSQNCREKTDLNISAKKLVVKKEDNMNESPNGDITALLKEESLHKYIDNFREQEIDINTLQHLSKDDLNAIGVESIGSQEKILKIIHKLQCIE